MAEPKYKTGEWFKEVSEAWGNYSGSYQATLMMHEVLHYEKSKYQEILVFKNEFWGTVLVLDGVIQCSTNDEFSYQEMISHPSLASHPNPKSALVIGGGDGGVLREICKHKGLEKIDICEIDDRVIAVSKQYLPSMAVGYSDPRVTLHVRDANDLIDEIAKSGKSKYDIIIIDSTDPVGFAAQLFEENFFRRCSLALNERGVIATQAENFWHQLDLLKNMYLFLGKIFKTRDYAWVSSPTYPCGCIGFWVLSNDPDTDHSKPRANIEDTFAYGSVKYYSKAMHSASFVLPAFAKAAIFDQK